MRSAMAWILAVVVAAVCLGGAWMVTPTALKADVLAVLGQAPEAAPALRFTALPEGLDGKAGQCVVCHSIERDGPFRVAPGLWGIVGAPKARAKWYGYSKALASAGGVWSEADLDKYLTDPDAFLPGTKKTLIGLPEDQRREIIAFLGTLGE